MKKLGDVSEYYEKIVKKGQTFKQGWGNSQFPSFQESFEHKSARSVMIGLMVQGDQFQQEDSRVTQAAADPVHTKNPGYLPLDRAGRLAVHNAS